MSDVLHALAALLAGVGAAYVTGYYATMLAMVAVAVFVLRAQRRRYSPEKVAAVLGSGLLDKVSLIIPAYNEELSIIRTVTSALGLRYPDLEIIVVNDGSKDRTAARLREAFDLVPRNRRARADLPTQPVRSVLRSRSDPRLFLVDKRNGGKADALNTGLNLSRGELVCVVDADVILHPDALVRLALPFAEDPQTVATSGTIRLSNGCRVEPDGRVIPLLAADLLARFQALEYARSFTIGRLFFNPLNAHLIISGAFGLFRRSLVTELGGYHPYAIGEDMELVVRIHARLRPAATPYRIVSVAEALLYTEAPRTVRELGKQRTRWHQGLLTSLRLHRRLLGNGRYGAVGLVAFPYFFAFELLSPFVELLGWILIPVLWGAGLLTARQCLPFFAAATLLSTLVSFLAVLIDSLLLDHYRRTLDRMRLLVMAILEPLGYHQMNLWFRFRAFPRFYGNIHIRTGWVPPTRAGAGPAAVS